MEAIILAGGLGTRLRSLVSDVPKPMALVGGKPFLRHLVDYTIKEGVTHIVFSVGYKGDLIIDYFKENPCGIDISFAWEKDPLGTGGAIINGLKECLLNDVFVLNGDTFFALDYPKFAENYRKSAASMSMALRYLDHTDRYGRAILQDDYITGFDTGSNDRAEDKAGWINAGIYLINRNLMVDFPHPEKFSFEQDFVEANIGNIMPVGFQSDAAFIDIGVPEDYNRAFEFLKKIGELD